MKTFFALCLALLAASAADAEVFRPQHVSGGRSPQGHAGNYHSAGYGKVGYGYGHGYPSYGRHHHGHGGYGYYRGPYGYSYLPRYGFYAGYGYGYPYYGGYGYPYYGGYSYGYPYYGTYGYSSPAATTGYLLGALAGGIIGNNSSDFHHNAWYGSMWGAGLGWVLGSAVDASRRSVEYAPAPVVAQPAPVVQSQPQPAAAAKPQQVTVINNYYNSSTPMGAANGMFGR